APAAAAAAM
nr:Chain P, PEPTIDE [Drosophila melanogaster]